MRFLLICSFLSITCFVKSQENLLKIADSFYTEKKYFEASLWAELVLYKNNTATENMQAIRLKIKALKTIKSNIELSDFIANCYILDLPDSFRNDLLYEEILNDYLLKKYEQSINLSQYYLTVNFEQKAILELLKIISYNELQEWKTADSLWQIFSSKNEVKDSVVAKMYKNLPHLKSEKKAATLSSLLPGAGEMYAGKAFEGIANFIFQGASIYTGVAWWQRSYKLSSVLVAGSFWSSFYDGGKRRAKNLVRQYNKKQITTYNEQLNKQILATAKTILKK